MGVLGASTSAVLIAGLLAFSPARAPAPGNAPDAKTIIARSVEANQRDWNADPEYSYTQTTRSGTGSKTWQVTMLFGSPYQKLIRLNGKPLSTDEQNKEEEKFQSAVTQRRSESESATASRIAKYEKDRHRDHLMMEQLTRAFEFRLTGQARLAGRSVYVLSATPRPDYRPPNMETQVLKGMRGTMWIDRQSFQWVRVRAVVISPVSIEGFLARVEPGTEFELDKAPVADGVWLPKHFSVRSHAKVLGVFHHQTSEDDTYSDYQKTPSQYLRKQ